MNGEWFKIKGYDYTGPNTVKFFEPFEPEPPAEPHTWHDFRCVDLSGTPKTPIYIGKFDQGNGELLALSIKELTEDNIKNQIWFWVGKKRQGALL